MSEVVERVARAIYEDMEAVEISFGNSAVWEKAGPSTRRKYMEAARAAIEAMKVPTEAMTAVHHGMAGNELCYDADDETTARVWNAMITEALK